MGVDQESEAWRQAEMYAPGDIAGQDDFVQGFLTAVRGGGGVQKDVDFVTVSWFDCDCDWITKYCAENHRKHTHVPRSTLTTYAGEK